MKCSELERLMIRHAVAADPGQRLRKRADDEIDVAEDTLRFGAAQAVLAVRAEGVRFVDQ